MPQIIKLNSGCKLRLTNLYLERFKIISLAFINFVSEIEQSKIVNFAKKYGTGFFKLLCTTSKIYVISRILSKKRYSKINFVNETSFSHLAFYINELKNSSSPSFGK